MEKNFLYKELNPFLLKFYRKKIADKFYAVITKYIIWYEEQRKICYKYYFYSILFVKNNITK